MNEKQEKMWDVLAGLDGETVARLLTDWHGTQLLDDGFFDHLVDEGYIDEPEEEEETNCEAGTYNCDSCCLNGDCPDQGVDGRPRWKEAMEADTFDELCSLFPRCDSCPLSDMEGDCEEDRWPKWKEEHRND